MSSRLAAASRAVLGVGLAALAAVLAVRTIARPRSRSSASIAVASSPSISASSSSAEPPRRGAPTGVVRPGPPSMFRLDPRHTNRSPFVAPRAPTIAWTVDLGGPIAAQPIVTTAGILVASLSGALATIDSEGKIAWKIDLEKRIYGSPLLVGETAYVGVDEKHFVAVKASTGAKRFMLDVDGDADTAPAPMVDGGIAFAAGHTTYAIRADGTVRWRYKTKRKTFASPAIADDGTIVIGTQSNEIVALLPDGTVRWKIDVGADADASPSIGDDGTIYAGTDGGEVLAIEPKSGTIRWRKAVDGYVRGALSIGRDGVVFASTYGPTPAIVALRPDDGAIVWKFSIRGTGAKEFGIHGAPIEDAEGTLVFGAQDDFVYALARDGQERWKIRVGSDVDQALVLAADGMLYAGSEDGKLYAIR